MVDNLETVAEEQANAFFSRGDEVRCANCGRDVIGRGYQARDGLVYHTRDESVYMHEALCCE